MINSKIEFGFHLVAFIDILGQKDLLADFDNRLIIGSSIREDELIKRIKESLGVVELFKTGFLDYFDSYSKSKSLIGLPYDLQSQYNAIRRADIRFKRFSDSILIYTPLFAGDYPFSMNSIYIILSSIAVQTLNMLAFKHPVRGGIDIGFGGEIDDLFYGPGLFKAYHLESKVADYPRVVVGKRLIKYIEDQCNTKGSSLIDKANHIYSKHCKQLFEKDHNDVSYIDLFAPDLVRINKENGFTYLYKNAYEFILESLVIHKGTPKLYDRYLLLKKYFCKNLKLIDGI